MYKDKLKDFTMDKHSSLMILSIRGEEKLFHEIGTRCGTGWREKRCQPEMWNSEQLKKNSAEISCGVSNYQGLSGKAGAYQRMTFSSRTPLPLSTNFSLRTKTFFRYKRSGLI